MKTNVTLFSTDRNLYGVVIRQDTKNSFLSLTDLQEAYTVARLEKKWPDRKIANILAYEENAERIFYILHKQKMDGGMDYHQFMSAVKESSLVQVLKKCGAYKVKGARENKVTMCNPYIWVLIAMELNPELYGEVVSWLTDRLIINRIEVGNAYNTLSRAASRFDDVDYSKIAKALNYIVFGRHETLLRNNATKEQLEELKDLQTKLAFAIDMGYINSYSELRKEILKMYDAKYGTYFATSKIK
jgi:hypothetical protein